MFSLTSTPLARAREITQEAVRRACATLLVDVIPESDEYIVLRSVVTQIEDGLHHGTPIDRPEEILEIINSGQSHLEQHFGHTPQILDKARGSLFTLQLYVSRNSISRDDGSLGSFTTVLWNPETRFLIPHEVQVLVREIVSNSEWIGERERDFLTGLALPDAFGVDVVSRAFMGEPERLGEFLHQSRERKLFSVLPQTVALLQRYDPKNHAKFVRSFQEDPVGFVQNLSSKKSLVEFDLAVLDSLYDTMGRQGLSTRDLGLIHKEHLETSEGIRTAERAYRSEALLVEAMLDTLLKHPASQWELAFGPLTSVPDLFRFAASRICKMGVFLTELQECGCSTGALPSRVFGSIFEAIQLLSGNHQEQTVNESSEMPCGTIFRTSSTVAIVLPERGVNGSLSFLAVPRSIVELRAGLVTQELANAVSNGSVYIFSRSVGLNTGIAYSSMGTCSSFASPNERAQFVASLTGR